MRQKSQSLSLTYEQAHVGLDFVTFASLKKLYLKVKTLEYSFFCNYRICFYKLQDYLASICWISPIYKVW